MPVSFFLFVELFASNNICHYGVLFIVWRPSAVLTAIGSTTGMTAVSNAFDGRRTMAKKAYNQWHQHVKRVALCFSEQTITLICLYFVGQKKHE